MIIENLSEVIELGHKAIALLNHVQEQALLGEQLQPLMFAIHHLSLAMKEVEKAFNIQKTTEELDEKL